MTNNRNRNIFLQTFDGAYMFSRSEPVREDVGYTLPIKNERGKSSWSKSNAPVLQEEPCAQGSDLSHTEV